MEETLRDQPFQGKICQDKNYTSFFMRSQKVGRHSIQQCRFYAGVDQDHFTWKSPAGGQVQHTSD